MTSTDLEHRLDEKAATTTTSLSALGATYVCYQYLSQSNYEMLFDPVLYIGAPVAALLSIGAHVARGRSQSGRQMPDIVASGIAYTLFGAATTFYVGLLASSIRMAINASQ